MSLRQSPLIDTRVIYCGDCLDQLKELPDRCIDLIYIDPPFNSNRNYEVFWEEEQEKRSFQDRHDSTQAYIEFMQPRCEQLARVMKKTGSFFYHCDWHASHYVKVMLDRLFGEMNFQNEIIWKRQSAHSDAKNRFPVITDSLFFYSGSKKATFHPQFNEHDVEYVKKFYRFDDKDGRGPYRLDNMTSPNPRPNMMYEWQGFSHPLKGWRYQRETMQELHDAGRIYYPRHPDGSVDTDRRPALKRYLREQKGSIVSNLWDDINPVHSSDEERVGYPTQKPLALLERIIESCTNKGDILLDAFCGCGTAIAAAEIMGRQWIGIDRSPTACKVMATRLSRVVKLPMGEKYWRKGRGFIVKDLPKTEEFLRSIPPGEFESWAVLSLSGTPNVSKVRDMGIDGRIYPRRSLPKDNVAQTQLDFMDIWYPVQVKQQDRVGRPDVDKFEAAMDRERKERGVMVAFSFSHDAKLEAHRYAMRTGKVISLITVRDILDDRLAEKLA